MNKKKYTLCDDAKKSCNIYQTDRSGVEKKIGDGFLCQTGKVIVVGIRAKEKAQTLFPGLKLTITTFVLGHSILHDGDFDNPSVGIHIAVKRAMKGKKMLYSPNYSMLNNGFCQAIVNDEARHIQEHIEEYYKEYKTK